jgi:hypothetical protein
LAITIAHQSSALRIPSRSIRGGKENFGAK